MMPWKIRAAGAVVAAAALVAAAAPASADDRVLGEIGRYYSYLGGPASPLGQPLTSEVRTPDGRGAYVVFQGGAIYWSPWTGAAPVRGEIREGWGRLGWEGGHLGFPLGPEVDSLGGRGRAQEFEGGTLVWAPWTGAHAVGGAIRDAYEGFSTCDAACHDGEDVLGFPVTSEIRTPDGRGAYNAFQWGSVYWSPATGAHPVRGEIRDLWGRLGWEGGRLGFPASAEERTGDGRVVQRFEGGEVVWWPGGSEVRFR